MLGIKSSNRLSFYDWETLELIRRIEISPKLVRSLSHDGVVDPHSSVNCHFLVKFTGILGGQWSFCCSNRRILFYIKV